MKRRVLALLGVAILVTVGSLSAAENATGTWKWTTTVGGESREATLKLKQEGDKLSGVYVGGQSNTETPIENPTIKDDMISFTVTRQRDGQKFTAKYSGKLAGDKITGTQERSRGGQKQSSEWIAKRQK